MDFDRLTALATWEPQYAAAVLAIGTATIAFIAYYFVMMSPKMEARIRGSHSEEEGQIRWVVFQRLWGGFILGVPALVLPALLLDRAPGDYGMSFGLSGTSLAYIGVLAAIIIPMNLFRARKPANHVQYPQIRAAKWDLKLLLLSSFSWVIYLLGYELLFRGLLLYGCVESIGIWPALAINASIYSFAHFFKGIGETVGAIPFGIAISLITLTTGNFMVAFIVHCMLALSNQTVAMFSHPDMAWVPDRKA